MKITYHIPLYYENQGKLLGTYSEDFINECLKTLHNHGVSYIQQSTIKVEKHSVFVDELLISFWANDLEDFGSLFIELVTKYHSDLCQQEYIYEFGENLVFIKGVS